MSAPTILEAAQYFPWNEIAAAILPRGGLIMLVNAYFDESAGTARCKHPLDGSRQDVKTLSVAGYLVESEQAKLLSQEWQAVLDQYGLPYFHMVDCAHGNGVFAKLTAKQRIQVGARMIGNIKRRTIRGFGISLNVSQFKSLMPPDHPLIKKPYTLCAHSILDGVRSWARENKYHGDIAYFFEAGAAGQKEANALMHALFETAVWRKACRYVGHSFVAKEQAAGVQAADLLAWQFHTETRRQLEKTGRPRRKDFESLFAHPHNIVFISPRDYVRICRAWGYDTSVIETNIKATEEYYAHAASLKGQPS